MSAEVREHALDEVALGLERTRMVLEDTDRRLAALERRAQEA